MRAPTCGRTAWRRAIAAGGVASALLAGLTALGAQPLDTGPGDGASTLGPAAETRRSGTDAAVAALDSGPNVAAARASLARLAPRIADHFTLTVAPADGEALDTFTVAPGRHGSIRLRGSTPATVLSAFSFYLEHVAHGQIARGGDHVPALTPEPSTTYTRTTPYRHRYVSNETAQGYSQAYWDWDDWQRELDLDASEGVTDVLVQTGADQVMYDTLRHFHYGDRAARDWIALPSQQGWQWRGDLRNDGPAIPLSVLRRRAALGRRIVARVRALGMRPVLPGFGDAVPDDFGARNGDPSAAVARTGTWHGLPRPAWADPTSRLYGAAARYYYAREARLFGSVHAHDLDLAPPRGSRTTGGTSPSDAAATAAAMRAADPRYVWVLPARSGLTPLELAGVEKEHLLVNCSGLAQATAARWRGDPFDGAPWMLGETGDPGGGSGLGGDLDRLATTLPRELTAAHRGHLAGTAYLPEGTGQNPVEERLWADMVWQDAPVDLHRWIAVWVRARYGTADRAATAAWRELLTSAYHSASHADSLFDAAPALTATRAAPRGSAGPDAGYDTAGVRDAWTALLSARARLGHLATYRHDLVDVTRQVVSDQTRPRLAAIRQDATRGDLPAFRTDTRAWLSLMRSEDRLLATRSETLLGTWTSAARRLGTTGADRDTMEYDARRILTVWDARATTGLTDAANREWAGLLGTYYLPRWSHYFQRIQDAMTLHAPLPKGLDWRPTGRRWAAAHGRPATRPSGDPAEAALDVAAHLAVGTTSPTPRTPPAGADDASLRTAPGRGR